MTDRELLEISALRAGIELDWDVPIQSSPWRITGTGDDKGPTCQWNPLADDGDALRLAVKLGIDINQQKTLGIVETFWSKESGCKREQYNNDPYAATRRAIVRAAVVTTAHGIKGEA
jgi:hypothetical protein